MNAPLVVSLLLLAALPARAAETYTIDTRHTFPRFSISHFGFSQHHGQFNKTAGKLRIDPSVGTASIEVSVETASVGTGDPTLETRLRSADFFDVVRHPTMTFRSKPFAAKGTVPIEVEGELTLLGITRPLTLQVVQMKCGPHPIAKREACGAEVTSTLRRSDYGMKYGVPALGDEVRITIQFEAVKD